MHEKTFEYLKPTEDQLAVMEKARRAFKELADELEGFLPEGPDKTYVMRRLRATAMWANVAITRNPDGSPRS